MVRNAPRTKVSASAGLAARRSAPVMTRYLPKKPPKGGMPMTERAQTAKETAVTGMVRKSPPSCRMSLLWVLCSTMPAQRKRPPLAMPCIRM